MGIDGVGRGAIFETPLNYSIRISQHIAFMYESNMHYAIMQLTTALSLASHAFL